MLYRQSLYGNVPRLCPVADIIAHHTYAYHQHTTECRVNKVFVMFTGNAVMIQDTCILNALSRGSIDTGLESLPLPIGFALKVRQLHRLRNVLITSDLPACTFCARSSAIGIREHGCSAPLHQLKFVCVESAQTQERLVNPSTRSIQQTSSTLCSNVFSCSGA